MKSNFRKWKRFFVMLLAVCTFMTQLDVSIFAMGKNTVIENADTEIVPATSITLNEETVRIGTDEWIKLIATVLPENCTEEVVWTSSDEGVVTVCEGLFGWEGTVHSLDEGTATITATVGNLSASCVVVVSNDVVFPDDPVDPEYSGLYFRKDGSIVYYIDGKIASDFVGLVAYEDEVYYVLNGYVPEYPRGLVCVEDVWYYIEGGKVNRNYVGLVQNYDSWFYVEEGTINWNYTGLTLYNGAWFYVEGGVLNANYTGLVLHNNAWFYVEGGVLNWDYTGLVLYNGTWFYVQGGMLNWDYTGLTLYNGTWFYVQGGMLNWDYTGLAPYNEDLFYVTNGILNLDYTGLVYYNDAWFYVVGGVVYKDYYGLAQNENGWWYVDAGCIDFGYNGLMTNANGTWGVNNGQVNFGLNGLIPWHDGWYYFQNGRLVEGNHLVPNEAGWWYVQDGKIDFTTHTVAQNENGWWYVEDGKINFDYNGQAQNDYGWWMIKNGQVDFSFSGEYNGYDVWGNSGTWYFSGGKRIYNTSANRMNMYFKYEKAYRLQDTSELTTEEKELYEGLKKYLDYAYQYNTLYEQELAIYDYMKQHCVYDEVLRETGIPSSPEVYTARGVFVNGVAVCSGYASAFDMCMEILGIPCENVISQQMDHEWNAVLLQGEWYWVDAMSSAFNCAYRLYEYDDATKKDADGERFIYYRMFDGYVTNVGEYYTYLQEHISYMESGEQIQLVVECEEGKWYFEEKYRKESLVPGAKLKYMTEGIQGDVYFAIYTWEKY